MILVAAPANDTVAASRLLSVATKMKKIFVAVPANDSLSSVPVLLSSNSRDHQHGRTGLVLLSFQEQRREVEQKRHKNQQ